MYSLIQLKKKKTNMTSIRLLTTNKCQFITILFEQEETIKETAASYLFLFITIT